MTGPTLKVPPLPPHSAGHSMLATQICRANPGVSLAFVFDSQGNVRAAERADPRLLKAAVALLPPFREIADRAAAELGCRALCSVVVEGEAASFALADVDGDRTAVVIGATDGTPGALRADALWLAQALRQDR